MFKDSPRLESSTRATPGHAKNDEACWMLIVQRLKSGASTSDPMGTPRISYFSASSYARERHSRSVSGLHEDVLNVSPRISYHNPAIHLERRLNYGKSYSFQDVIPARNSATSVASSETLQAKSVADLVREISTLELEVVHLERYLLSLYRTAFDQYLASSSVSTHHTSREHVESNRQTVAKDVDQWKSYQTSNLAVSSKLVDDAKCQLKNDKSIGDRSFINGHIEQSSADHLAVGVDTKNDIVQCTSGHRSLADHLGASITDHVPEICCKLSEDIVRCIASIYCKLASPLTQSIDPLASPSPSVSSSSTFSRKDHSDSWSPKCHFEVAATPQTESRKDKSRPYNDMIEVPQLRIDGERFGYASKMLKIFRSLIRRLETIDPRKLTNEEQLAFWINIHNALVMHAFLAYGLRDNRIKSSSSLLKAAYNVGGHSVTAYLIQSSIFGCQPHRPSVWLGKWFSPAVKFMTGNGKHVYALDHFEPLVHFALCSGASSDPALRAYMAKSIYQDLEVARGEFIQSNVSIVGENKVMLPKILEYYAKDAALELPDLVKMVCDYMPEAKRLSVQGCHRRRLEKFVVWSPYKSSFKYIVHTDLAKEYNPAASDS